jgi:hypothetical protein
LPQSHLTPIVTSSINRKVSPYKCSPNLSSRATIKSEIETLLPVLRQAHADTSNRESTHALVVEVSSLPLHQRTSTQPPPTTTTTKINVVKSVTINPFSIVEKLILLERISDMLVIAHDNEICLDVLSPGNIVAVKLWDDCLLWKYHFTSKPLDSSVDYDSNWSLRYDSFEQVLPCL